MDMHFANANAPQWETNIKNKPTEAKWSRRVEVRKMFVPPPYTASSGRRGRRSFGCHAEEDGMETCADSWRSYDQEQLGFSSSLVLWRKQPVFGQMVWERFLPSLQLFRKGVGCHCWKNVNQWKGRVVSSSPVVSGLCSNMIEIWETMMMSSG